MIVHKIYEHNTILAKGDLQMQVKYPTTPQDLDEVIKKIIHVYRGTVSHCK